ncbi:MAG: calcium/sodium antiporter [Mariprofundaceae bacterium]|nr:calcium/sodium antiporter [Mariprofundaceae bacterium]
MLPASLAVVAGFILLAWSADRFVDGAASIARHFRISPMIIGLTIVSLCTSFPEMLVAALAASAGNSDIGIGNALGSNIANIGLVLGITAMISPLSVQSLTLRREIPVLFLVMFLALALMADGDLSRVDGMALLAGLLLMLWWLTRLGIKERNDPLEDEYDDVIPAGMTLKRSMFWFVTGLAVLIISSRIVVWGSVEIAHMFGISDLVIGLTIIAIGTSLPELMASVMGALKGEHDLAIGNVIGSNMFNILAVLSMPALIHPQAFAADALLRDFPVMLLFSVALFLMAFGFRSDGRINRLEGALLAGGFIGYLYLLYLQV